MFRATLIAILLLPAVALAHGLRLTITVGDEAIAGRATYADGSPLADAPVELQTQGDQAPGATLARSRTDADGRFAFPAPRNPGAYRIAVDDGLGHRRETFLTLGTARAPGPTAAIAAAPIPAAAPALVIADSHANAGWQQWLSGLGYLLGVFGLASWWASRRRAGRPG